MNKPQFPHCNTVYTIGWILTIPILLDICTCCTLFSFWLVWVLFILVTIICIIRLIYGFKQKCYKFCWGLIAQLLLGFGILSFFQLSFNHTIETPLSNAVSSDVVEIADPVLTLDSVQNKKSNSHDTIHHAIKQRKSSHKDS